MAHGDETSRLSYLMAAVHTAFEIARRDLEQRIRSTRWAIPGVVMQAKRRELPTVAMSQLGAAERAIHREILALSPNATADIARRLRQRVASALSGERCRSWHCEAVGLRQRIDAAIMAAERCEAVLVDELRAVVDHASDNPPVAEQSEGKAKSTGNRKATKRTERGKAADSDEKIIAALRLHHKYENDGCLNTEPATNTELAELVGVHKGTVTRFLNRKFGGRKAYLRSCHSPAELVFKLKLLFGEVSPMQMDSLENARVE